MAEQEKLMMLGRVENTRRNVIMNVFSFFFDDTLENIDDVNQTLRSAIVDKADSILSATVNCWNDIDIFRAREYFFTTMGLFTYHDEDKEKLEKQIKTDELFQHEDSDDG